MYGRIGMKLKDFLTGMSVLDDRALTTKKRGRKYGKDNCDNGSCNDMGVHRIHDNVLCFGDIQTKASVLGYANDSFLRHSIRTCGDIAIDLELHGSRQIYMVREGES